jgi:hypothetical protein
MEAESSILNTMPTNIGGDMNKQLKSTGKKGYESVGKGDQVIDLEDVVDQKTISPDQNEGEILELTDEISSNEQENLETGVIELTKPVPPLSDDKATSNIIHLAEMTFTHNSADSSITEELSKNEIVELSNNSPEFLDYERNDQLSEQLESTIADSFGDGEDIIETLPDTNLVDIDNFDGFERADIDDDLDDFDLLSESESKLLSESDMEYGIDPIDVKEIDDNDIFDNFGNALSEELEDLPNFNDDDTDEGFSETALALNRAMQADRDSVYQDEEEELNEEIESIRSRLDNVFPEEDSQDAVAAFNSMSDYGREYKEEDDNRELILQPFDENEFEVDESSSAFNDSLLEANAIPLNDGQQPQKNSIADPFAGDDHVFDTENMLDQLSEEQRPQDRVASFNLNAANSDNEIEKAVQRLLETKYSKKIEQIIVQTIEKKVAREIAKIKKAILNKPDPLN